MPCDDAHDWKAHEGEGAAAAAPRCGLCALQLRQLASLEQRCNVALLGHHYERDGAAPLGLAVLLPVVPFALEMLALRRLTTGAFGTLMALEPAFALVIGFLALHQTPGLLAVLGVGLVVVAGAGAESTGSRTPPEAALAGPLAGPTDSRAGSAPTSGSALRE